MPSTPPNKSKPLAHDTKPYWTPSTTLRGPKCPTPSLETKPDIKHTLFTASPSPSRGGPKGKPIPWTGHELKAVFEHVAAKMGGAAAFEGAVPGRSGHQTYMCWRQVVQPTCKSALLAKGVKK